MNKIKKIATWIIAGTLALLLLSLTACAGTYNTGSDPSAEDPSKPTGTKYSQILQNVLTDDYYNEIISEYKESHWYSSNRTTGIPYRFLELQGLDVAAIKNDKIKCDSTAYVYNDDTTSLYLIIKIEIPNGSNNYYHCYKLKYNLTDKEYKDLYMLHEGSHIQSPFFIQELSKTKTPTVLNNVKVDKKTYDKLEELCNKINDFRVLFNGTMKIDLEITDAKHITIECRSTPLYNAMLRKNCRLRPLHCFVYTSSGSSFENNLFKMRAVYEDSLASLNLEEFKSTYSTITCFYTLDVNQVNLTLSA